MSIKKITSFMVKYIANGSTKVYYRWARNFASECFFDLHPLHNLHFFVLISGMRSEVAESVELKNQWTCRFVMLARY